MKAPLLFLAVFGLLAAACTGGSESADESAQLIVADTVPTTTATTVATSATSAAGPASKDSFEPQGRFTAWHGAPDTTAPPVTEAAKDQPVTTKPSGGSSGPATTSKPSGSQSPLDLYEGLLGTYSLDQVLAKSPVPKPSAAPGTQPLTGLGGSPANRPAIVVKVDNSSKARPHTGLNKADIVFEEEVEHGITRLAAVFHTNETTVGPVRSGRSTDVSFLNGFGTPALVYSGANKVIDQVLLNQTNVSNYSAARSSGYWRSNDRPAPSNLYTKTSSFSGVAPGGAPPAQFHYRPSGVTSSQGIEHAAFGLQYPKNRVRWEWAGTHWVRQQGGANHVTDGEGVTASNVVVVGVQTTGTGLFDSTGAPVPEYLFIGEGPAVVFTDGRRVDGRWVRPTLRDPAMLHADGEIITLTPGRTWVQIVSGNQYLQDG